jgi:hypothetical protein
MKRADICPICGYRLKAGKTLRMVCSTPGCTFKDRRHGNSIVDPLVDKREGTNRYVRRVEPYDPTRDVWGTDRRWQKS